MEGGLARLKPCKGAFHVASYDASGIVEEADQAGTYQKNIEKMNVMRAKMEKEYENKAKAEKEAREKAEKEKVSKKKPVSFY